MVGFQAEPGWQNTSQYKHGQWLCGHLQEQYGSGRCLSLRFWGDLALKTPSLRGVKAGQPQNPLSWQWWSNLSMLKVIFVYYLPISILWLVWELLPLSHQIQKQGPLQVQQQRGVTLTPVDIATSNGWALGFQYWFPSGCAHMCHLEKQEVSVG